MFKFQVNGIGHGGLIEINTDDPEEQALFKTTPTGFIELFKKWLSQAQGPFGHFLGPDTIRANDLDFALSQDSKISYELVEGELSDYPAPEEGQVF